ncbi:MAG: uracil-DNA glycosylase [Bacteroidia bacterium]|nr:uracil-DNA glycosylase [Bacteroidia bacterium]
MYVNITTVTPKIEASWLEAMKDEFSKDYFASIKMFLKSEMVSGKVIYPPGRLIFNAFNHTPFDKLKCLIVGQDPYHGTGQANGLCFSVARGMRQPPSLVNIFKELNNDLGIPVANHGDLTSWANEGVLLLNASLTVEAGKPSSHSKIGWEIFTDAVIKKVSDARQHIVFILWGKFAQSKADLIDTSKHCLLAASHPSPYSAANGFFGCRHFSKTNDYLISHGIAPIDWKLS